MNNKNSIGSFLYLIYKLVRPIMPLSSGVAVWIVARSCGATIEESLAAAISMALGTIGASFYHYGGANWMYTRKSERFKFKDPEIIRLIGLTIFSFSISIAVLYLPKLCVLICVFNTLAIAAYSAKLSSHWITKNILISIICTTPVVIGWQAGTVTSAIVLWTLGLALIAYLSREIIKDVKDIITNEGKRITLPMVLGTEQALQLSGGLLLLATMLAFVILQFTNGIFQTIMAILSTGVLLSTALMLLVNKKAGRSETLIQVSICFLLLALL